MKYLFKMLMAFMCMLIIYKSGAQNVAINNDGSIPDPKAILDIKSNLKGILIPRMLQTERQAITTPPQGLIVYQTDAPEGIYYQAAVTGFVNWKRIIPTDGQYWTNSLSGNHIYNVNSGNVGIGVTNPAHLFTLGINGQGITQQSNDGSTKIGFYTGTNAAYLQTVTNHPIYFATANGTAQMTLGTNGNLGVGNTLPNDAGLVVDTKVGAVNAMFGRNTTGVAIESNSPGIGLNSYYNASRKTISAGYTGLVSLNPSTGDLTLFNSSTSTATDAAATIAARLTISNAGNIGVEGNTAPVLPLSFANTLGNKISLYGSSVSANYGLGIQGSLLQMYSSSSLADIAFGYGSSTNFSENMRIRGNGNVGIGTAAPTDKLQISTSSANAGISVTQNGTGIAGYFYSSGGNAVYAFNNSPTQPVAFFQGNTALSALGNVGIGVTNPSFYLDMKGRARLRMDGATTPGIWFNKPDDTQGSFIGQYDANNFGIWGPGAVGNWNFLFDGSDGTLRIGTTQKATGYLVNVGGKIVAEEVRVQLKASWPDYVFENDYKLLPLNKLEHYLNTNKHLPGIPAAREMEKGLDIGDMQKKMMEKIEQLTLYAIEQNKRIELLEKKLAKKNNN